MRKNTKTREERLVGEGKKASKQAFVPKESLERQKRRMQLRRGAQIIDPQRLEAAGKEILLSS